ncbi:MAG: hypothetical protein M3Y90_08155 [Actinomycetota bacterium]|nr:hypothetical protein [Actinomycetota bacterium]
MPTINHAEENSALGLVRKVRDLGIAVPEAVNAEAKLYQDTRQEESRAGEALRDASAKLATVSLDEFDAAKQELVSASNRLFAVHNGLGDALLNVAGERLLKAVYSATADWEAEAVARFNSIVDEFGLNEVAGDLPNLADVHNSGVLSLGRAQGEAVERWRNAADRLHPLWSAYTTIARLEGHDIGRVTADSRSSGLVLACRLGHPGTLGVADAAATTFVSVSEGTDSAKRWGPLMPFVVPVLRGYELHLHTSDEAAAIRLEIQPGATG